jgi:hypothetical protein
MLRFFSRFVWPLYLLIFLLTAVFGIGGIRFGKHGDEPRLLNAAAESARTLLLLPRWYNYPSLSYDIVVASGLPEWKSIVLEAVRKGAFSPTSPSEDPGAAFTRPGFFERNRIIFFFLTWISLIWIFLAARSATKQPWAAAFAFLLAASSWELQYHARWIAPDGLVVSFGSLSFAALLWFFSTQRQTWLWIAAAGAGLACGAKYPGGIFLVPVLIACLEDGSSAAWKTRIRSSIVHRRWLATFIIFIVSFFVTTPGALVDPFKFISGILFEVRHYHEAHGANTVHSVFEHAQLLMRYLATVLFSSNRWIGLAGFSTVVVGMIVKWKHLPSILRAALYLPPLLYIVYMSTQHVMIVRNYLLLLPFLCVFSAYGIQTIWEHVKRPLLRLLLVSLITCSVGYNLAWQYKAMMTIRHPEQTTSKALAALQSTQEPFTLSSQAQSLLGPINDTPSLSAQWYVFLDHEIDERYPANHAGLYRVLGGSLESNPDFYPTFLPGPVKVIMMRADVARAHHILP